MSRHFQVARVYASLFSMLEDHAMHDWAALLNVQLNDYFDTVRHGDYPKWQQAIDDLPTICPSCINLNSDRIRIGDSYDCSTEQQQQIKHNLKALMPWRKGPFCLFGIAIDAEWRSNLKWARLKEGIRPLQGKLILDVGCGNGYYGWRMLGEGAMYVLGLDPTLLFLQQFNVFKKYLPEGNIDIIPFGIQTLPEYPLNFDTVFSMGVIYHRRDPLEHLRRLKRCLKPGGELVLEGLIIDSDEIDVLKPAGRYARMNNVWAIPNIDTLMEWVRRSGFDEPRILDISKTGFEEQAATEWMRFESLSDCLDKENNDRTIEGYPAPVRAILVANKKL